MLFGSVASILLSEIIRSSNLPERRASCISRTGLDWTGLDLNPGNTVCVDVYELKVPIMFPAGIVIKVRPGLVFRLLLNFV